MYTSREAAPVGLGQSSADDGTALVEEPYQHAKMEPHLKPKRFDEAQSFVEQSGVTREEYHLDIARGHRSSGGRPSVKIGGVGKFSTAEALDYEAGRPYVRKRDRAPYASPPAGHFGDPYGMSLKARGRPFWGPLWYVFKLRRRPFWGPVWYVSKSRQQPFLEPLWYVRKSRRRASSGICSSNGSVFAGTG